MPLPDVVLDTNVIIAALRSKRGASSKLLSLLGTDLFRLHISVPLLLEYEEVLLRQSSTLGLTPQDVVDLIDSISALSIPHEIHFLWRPQLRDPDDEFVLELAVAARCSHIITYNQRDFREIDQFGIAVSTPKAFLFEIGVLP